MLFCSSVCKRLEQMGVMCRSVLNRPGLHAGSDLVCDLPVDFTAELNCRQNSFISLLGHVPSHLVEVKHIPTEIMRNRSVFNVETLRFVRSRLIQGSLSKCSHKTIEINFKERPQR